MEFIKLNIESHVARITLSREQALNALNTKMLLELDQVLSEILQNLGSVRVVVLTGAGSKAFVAGADIGEMVQLSPLAAREFLERGQRVLDRVEALPVPTVALINGFALGGGLELALACDIRIATENAVLGLPEVNLGLIPSFGGTQRLTRIVGIGLAKQMIFLGQRLKASEALALGLVAQVCTFDQREDQLNAMIQQLMGKAPIALHAAKMAIHAAHHLDLSAGQFLEVNLASMCFSSSDLREGMQAFLEKRSANFQKK